MRKIPSVKGNDGEPKSGCPFLIGEEGASLAPRQWDCSIDTAQAAGLNRSFGRKDTNRKFTNGLAREVKLTIT